jgi:dienelactone hydrolase
MLRAMRFSRCLSVVVVVVAGALLAGCGGSAKPTPKTKTTADWIADGTIGVGTTSFTFVDSSRPTPANGTYAGAPDRTLVTQVWYPSTTPGGPMTDAPLLAGHYPLVLHSHGYMDSNEGESYLGAHLASYGYIVAAPNYPLSMGGAPGNPTIADTAQQPLDATFVIDQLLATSGGTIAIGGSIDADRIVASGLSLGGLTTLLLAYHPTSRDPRLKAALAMAPPSCMFTADYFNNAPALPLLMMLGSSDAIVDPTANEDRIFPLTKTPSELMTFAAGSHTGFATAASFLNAASNYDAFGCMELGNVDASSFASLGTAAQGIAQDPSVCPAACTTIPTTPSLDAGRQQDLTKAAAQAFFDGVLGRNAAGATFVQTGIAAENTEVTVQVRQ